MAEVQWIKITTDMFANRKIRYLRRLPDGDSVVLIWVMLLTLAGRCNAGGMIYLTKELPYSTSMLANELDVEEATVQLALNALEHLGMVTIDDTGVLCITKWEEHQNIEGMEKIRESKRLAQARWREKKKRLIAENSVDSTVEESTRYLVDDADKNRIDKKRIEKNYIIPADELQRTRFVKPSLEEVTAYCKERKNSVNPQAFLDHYESNGWRVGKNAMKDWKAAVRTWEKNSLGRGKQQTQSHDSPEQRSYSPDDLVEYPPGSGCYVLRAEMVQR